MYLKELKKRLQSGEIDPCYYVVGEDEYIKKRAIEAIEAALAIEVPELNRNVLSGNVPASELSDRLQQLPFAGSYRLLLVHDYMPAAGDAALLYERFLSRETSGSILVMTGAKPSDAFKKYMKEIVLVECPHPGESDCILWITKRMKNDGLAISSQTAGKIAEYSLMDMSAISLQCDKLAAYLAGRDSVSDADVETAVTKRNDFKIYEFTNAVAARNKVKAFEIMNSLKENSGTDESSLLAALYAHYRRMLYVSVTKGMNFAELAGMLDVKEYAVKKTAEQAKLFSPKALKQAVGLLAETEYAFKSGRINIETSFNAAILRLINT